jgi:hypothetical protein
LYITVISTSFTAFRCFPQDDGSFSLISNPSLDCYDSQWFAHISVIVLSICIICFAPILLFSVLYYNRNRRHSNHFQWRFGYLATLYKPRFYYWEVVSLLFKTIFVCLVDLTNAWNKFERSFILILFFCMLMLVDLLVDPYQEISIPVAEIRMVWNIISILMLLVDSLIYRDSLSFSSDTNIDVLGWIFIILIASALFYTFIRIFYKSRNSNRFRLLKKSTR